MRRSTTALYCVLAAAILCLALGACPNQSSYPSTITPIYAGTDSGLFAFDGANWTNYTKANSGLASDIVQSVVVAASGSGARIYAGTTLGVSRMKASTWVTWNMASGSGIGGDSIHGLFLGSNLFAATSGGVSAYDDDGSTWSNDGSVVAVNEVYLFRSFTYVAADSGLFIYNGTARAATIAPASAILAGSTRVKAVVVDSNQGLFVATDMGAFVENPDSTFSNLMPDGTDVNDLCLDSYDGLYIASAVGLFYSGNGATAIPIRSGSKVNCVHVDGAGTIYAGTDAGLAISLYGRYPWATSLSGKKINCVVTTAPLYAF